MHKRLVLTAAVTALLAGCGGGSQNDCALVGCGGVGGPGTGLMLVDRNTAIDALLEAWISASSTADVPFLVIATNIGDTSGGTVGLPGGDTLKFGLGQRPSFVPFGPTAYNCPVSGTFTVDGDVADMFTVTTGDIVNYQASACDSGTGFVVDGNHTIEIASIVGDPTTGSFEQGQLLTFANFQAVSATRDITLNGDHTAVIDTQPVATINSSFAGNSLQMTEGQSAVTATTFLGTTSVQTVAPFNYQLTAAGNANSTVLQGSVDYQTEGSRLAVMDNTTVRIQVDANGSGNYEISMDFPWTEFLNGTATLAFAPEMPE